MSLRKWKEEFYPVPANRVPKTKALEHSIRKWSGLLPSNLNRHGLIWNFKKIMEKESCGASACFAITTDTCALCMHHYSYDGSSECPSCPLSIVRGMRCDRVRDGENPYQTFIDLGDPKPMLRWLRKARKASAK